MSDPSAGAMLLKGLLLGLGAAVPIGPVNVEIARRTLRWGFSRGAMIGGGACTADVAYAIVSALGWAPLLDKGGLVMAVGVAGVLLLLYLAAMCFRGAWRSFSGGGRLNEDSGGAGEAPSIRSTYVTGLLMTLLNPMTLAFWFVVLPAMAAQLTTRPRHDLPFLCGGVFVGAFGWAVFFAAVLSILGRFRRDLWALAADAVGGLVLLGFAVVAAWRMVKG